MLTSHAMSSTGRPNSFGPFAKGIATTLPITSSMQSANEPAPAPTFLTGIRIDGQILAHEDIYIGTDISAPITSNCKVTIGPDATVHAEIRAREIVVLGRVIGNVEATEKVALCDGADMRGDIITVRISMAEKAYFAGKIDCMPDTDAHQVRSLPPASSPDSRGRTSPETVRPSRRA